MHLTELSHVFQHALTITGFVFVMMLLVEYINVQTKGAWQKVLHKWRWGQYLIAASLGVIPGCLGTFTVVTLFSHRVVSLGALVAVAIASCGDEAFVMIAMLPQQALVIFAIIFIIGIIAGYVTDKLICPATVERWFVNKKLPIHQSSQCAGHVKDSTWCQLRSLTMERALLLIIIAILFYGIFTGNLGHQQWGWVSGTMLVVTLIALFIVASVPEHFLKKHLWEHIAKKHTVRIFLWTLATLAVIHLLLHHLDVKALVSDNLYLVLLIAVLVGLLPESGPHLVFVTLFFTGTIPLSILLASSIVQDGHGLLPLFAESKRSFVIVKGINMLVGLAVGLVGLSLT